MPWSYIPLWKLLLDKKLKRTDLTDIAGIHRQTLARMGRGESVSMEALEKICTALGCRIEEVLEFVPAEKTNIEK